MVGVREYEGQLGAVIAVDESADAPSGRHQRQKVSSATLPVAAVAAVAAVLRQFDVRLDAIDIVSARKRHVCEAVDPSAVQTVDDRPAGVQHGTWLVLWDGSAAQIERVDHMERDHERYPTTVEGSVRLIDSY